MNIIKCLAAQIEDELEDAKKYAELALKWKEEQPKTADLFLELSTEEMGHMKRLHEHAQELIEEYREEHGEPPEGMLLLYNYLHEKHMAAATEIRVKQGMYKLQD